MEHKLKTWPEYFQAILSGQKQFEIRYNDRAFKLGDMLLLQEFNQFEQTFTGRKLKCHVIYVTDFEQKTGFVVLGIAQVQPL